MADTTATETSQTEGEGPESSDKPPHGQHRAHSSSTKHSDKSSKSNGYIQRQSSAKSTSATNGVHVPLPPPESHSFPKAPGTTRQELEQLTKSTQDALAPQIVNSSPSTTGSISPSTSGSRSPSEYESSLPSTQPNSRAPSRPASRPASFSAGKSGGKVGEAPSTPSRPPSRKDNGKTPSRTPSTNETPGKSKRSPSVHSDSGTKFTLKDLLGSTKLVRKSSARSTGSSKKSDSERGPRSTAGDSTQSLSKKYGVCEKVAIGKGATSVVRLAHKWDRSEEKVYAVKVRIISHPCHFSQYDTALPYVDVSRPNISTPHIVS